MIFLHVITRNGKKDNENTLTTRPQTLLKYVYKRVGCEIVYAAVHAVP